MNLELFIDKKITIKQALKILDITAKKILFVIEDNRLLGTITDGDIRRWILKNGDLNDTVNNIMNKKPITLNLNNKSLAKKIIKENNIEAIPIVDDENKVIEIVFFNENNKLNNTKEITNPVIIMAGGKGTRLYPYTKILPKPLIPIGDYSISERIIERFYKHGCKNFYFTLNYKKNMIKAYFDELEKDYNINYIEEEKFLGTGGSLHLLKDKINETFFLSNCDILVEADYLDILNYHKNNKNKITMVTSIKDYKIPYGIIKLNNNGEVISTEEKPELTYLVNTGFYILEPEVLNDIPENEFFHITDLINKYLKEGKKVGTYPIAESSWLDMGEVKEMDRMIERLGL